MCNIAAVPTLLHNPKDFYPSACDLDKTRVPTIKMKDKCLSQTVNTIGKNCPGYVCHSFISVED